MKTRNNRGSGKTALFISVSVVALLTIFYGGLFLAFILFWRGDQGALNDTAKITEMTGLSFPKDAQVMGGDYLQAPNKLYLIGRVRLPAASETNFANQSGWPAPVVVKDVSYLDPYMVQEIQARGWRFSRTPRLLSLEKMPSTGTPRANCVIDLGEETPVAYVYLND